MSIIIEYFTAPDDASAAAVLEGGPEAVFETMTCGNFLADLAMADWEILLADQSPRDQEQGERPRVVVDDGPRSSTQIFAASPELQAALAGADRERLATIAHEWARQYSEDYGDFEPDTACEIFYELADLARSANAQQHTLYCWMC